MSDNLRYRIAAVLCEHVEDQLTNYDAGRNECGCGNQGLSGYVEHVADAVIRELEAIPFTDQIDRSGVRYPLFEWNSSDCPDYLKKWIADE